MTQRKCRFCDSPLTASFADLGMTPLSNAFVAADHSNAMEPFYPLHAWVCDSCRLVQLEAFETPQHIFEDYIYFSSYSESWLRHAEDYANKITPQLGLGPNSLVVEVASNDGYLLKFFVQRGIPVLGVEPAENVAAVAISQGIPCECAFFGVATATWLRERGDIPDLIVANNVLAHVPDLNDFVQGLAVLLSESGTITVEFPHLLSLIRNSQFDTIYHEHFSYFSLHVIRRIFSSHGLDVFDAEELPTHGGSLRIYARHARNDAAPSPNLAQILLNEAEAGLEAAEIYRDFAERIIDVKLALLQFLIDARKQGKLVAAYGAPAKGNTLLNYCGIGPELIAFTVDRNPHKQGMLLPGTRIPVRAPDALDLERPAYVVILPWNLQKEITEQMAHIRNWGGRFVVPIPAVQILP